jgi:DNA polymerase-3 subunit gamma/tau
VTYRAALGLLGVTDDALLDETIDALAAADAPGVFRAVDRVVEAGHDPRRFATDLLDRLRDLIVLDAVPEAGGNGLLDCPPDRLDLMSSQAAALGSATLSRLADTVHAGLTEMRGTTAPRLLLELVCARMLLPATDGSSAAVLQRLERLERRLSIAGEQATREETGTEAAVPAPHAESTPARSGPPRREFVRPSQASGDEAVTAPPPARPIAPAAAPADDGWPETVPPGSGRPPAAAAGEPDIPLPPEPTDDEDQPHPARPAAAESSPAPRGAEPLPTVSANPEPSSGAGELTTADVRRMWPELLAVVKRHKRTTEALLKNAQVHELRSGVLTLSTSSPALARRIGDDLNRDVLREALSELLGVRWKVEAVVEGAAHTPAAAVPPEVAQAAARVAEAAEARELMAERSAEKAGGAADEPAPVVDPEEAALSLLRAHLGARPVEG